MKALHSGTAGRTRTECSRSTLKPLRTAALTELAYLKRAEWSVKGAAFMDTMPVQQQATGKGRPCSRRCSEYPWCMKGFTVLRHVPRHPEVIETAAAAVVHHLHATPPVYAWNSQSPGSVPLMPGATPCAP